MSRICVVTLACLLGAAPAWGQSITAPPSLGSLFRDLGQDVARMPSRESAIIVGLAAALSAGSRHRDAEITASASGNQTLDESLDGGAVLGSGWVQIGGALTTYIVGRS